MVGDFLSVIVEIFGYYLRLCLSYLRLVPPELRLCSIDEGGYDYECLTSFCSFRGEIDYFSILHGTHGEDKADRLSNPS